MSNQTERKTSQLFDDYVTAYFAGTIPRTEDYLRACPDGSRERLREAIAGFVYTYENYYTTQISENSVQSALERIQRIRRRKDALVQAEARARAISWEDEVTEPLQRLAEIMYPVSTGHAAQRVAVLNRSTVTQHTSISPLSMDEKRVCRRFAGREAERMLLRADWDDNPVSLDVIAAQLGLLVLETPLRSIEGCLLTDGETGGILLNSRTNDRRRKRFTFAHEIAHFLLHRTSQHRFSDQESQLYSTTSRLEFEASAFASFLLMPPPLLPDWFGREVPSFVQADQVSNDFDVSLMAVLRRLVQDSNYRTYVLKIEGDQVKWFDFSPEVYGFNRVVTHISSGTAASELYTDLSTETLQHEGSARDWFERGEIADENATVIEESRRFNSGHIYTLLTVKE